MSVVAISVQATPTDRASWLELAGMLEVAGFDALYVPDHPGSTPAPFVALAAAASVTQRLGLGTSVLNAGSWDPLTLAREVATLDALCEGRAILGIGAGHTPEEWLATGRPLPGAAARVDRMIELTDLTQRLLAGETVTHTTSQFRLVEAALGSCRPIQNPVPLLIGGNGARVLTHAARHADIVGITGLGTTLSDGHHHEVDWSLSATEVAVDRIQRAAATRTRSPDIEALIQHVQCTEDREGAAARLVEHVPGATIGDLLATPYVWLGTVDEIAAQLDNHSRRLGITRYVVRADAAEVAGNVLSAMAEAG